MYAAVSHLQLKSQRIKQQNQVKPGRTGETSLLKLECMCSSVKDYRIVIKRKVSLCGTYDLCFCGIAAGNAIIIFLNNDVSLHSSMSHQLLIKMIIFMTHSTG